MNTTLTIDRAGRVIIPKVLRDEMHLEAGDALELEAQDGQITLRPVRTGSALRKEQGVWVFRRRGAAISADATTRVLEALRNERDGANRAPQK